MSLILSRPRILTILCVCTTLLCATLLSGCLPTFSRLPNVEEGVASWYGPGFQGNLTANGETFDTHTLTAAHQYLPFDTLVRVTNLENAKQVVVRINDRGPFVNNRVIDLSQAAAEAIDMLESGTARVRLEPLVATQEASWRVEMQGNLAPYDVLSRVHKVGELLLLDSGKDQLMVRVTGSIPKEENVDLFVSRDVYALLDFAALAVKPVS